MELTDQDRQHIIDQADIRELKLTSGETLIAESFGVVDHKLVMHEPYLVHFTVGGRAVFRRWFVSANDNMKYIPEDYIITYTECCDLVKKQYIRAVLEDQAIEKMEADPDNYEFYTDPADDTDIIH